MKSQFCCLRAFHNIVVARSLLIVELGSCDCLFLTMVRYGYVAGDDMMSFSMHPDHYGMWLAEVMALKDAIADCNALLHWPNERSEGYERWLNSVVRFAARWSVPLLPPDILRSYDNVRAALVGFRVRVFGDLASEVTAVLGVGAVGLVPVAVGNAAVVVVNTAADGEVDGDGTAGDGVGGGNDADGAGNGAGGDGNVDG